MKVGIARTIHRTGGTFLHTSRTNPSKVRAKDLDQKRFKYVSEFKGFRNFGLEEQGKDLTAEILKNIKLKLDIIIPIGGDDSLGYAIVLHEHGVKTVAIPKTMDGDVYGTEYTIGFPTAVTRATNFVNELRTSAGSHERILLVELFRRHAGFVTFNQTGR